MPTINQRETEAAEALRMMPNSPGPRSDESLHGVVEYPGPSPIWDRLASPVRIMPSPLTKFLPSLNDFSQRGSFTPLPYNGTCSSENTPNPYAISTTPLNLALLAAMSRSPSFQLDKTHSLLCAMGAAEVGGRRKLSFSEDEEEGPVRKATGNESCLRSESYNGATQETLNEDSFKRLSSLSEDLAKQLSSTQAYANTAGKDPTFTALSAAADVIEGDPSSKNSPKNEDRETVTELGSFLPSAESSQSSELNSLISGTDMSKPLKYSTGKAARIAPHLRSSKRITGSMDAANGWSSPTTDLSPVETAKQGKVFRKEDSVSAILDLGKFTQKRSGDRKPCNCKKSQCLKLYCECFAARLLCNGCNCIDCSNTSEHTETRNQALKLILERNPRAFESKINTSRHLIGCHCKKTNCLKKYCECFHAGVLCGENCKCSSCKNTDAAFQASGKKPHVKVLAKALGESKNLPIDTAETATQRVGISSPPRNYYEESSLIPSGNGNEMEAHVLASPTSTPKRTVVPGPRHNKRPVATSNEREKTTLGIENRRKCIRNSLSFNENGSDETDMPCSVKLSSLSTRAGTKKRRCR